MTFEGKIEEARALSRRFHDGLFGEELHLFGGAGVLIRRGRRGSATWLGIPPSSWQGSASQPLRVAVYG